jgi:hypothetical protein
MTAEEMIMEPNLIEVRILFEFTMSSKGIVNGEIADEGYQMWAIKKVLLPFVPRVGDTLVVGYSFGRSQEVRKVLVHLDESNEIDVYLESMEPTDRLDWLERLIPEGWTVTFQ